jgi:Chromo (CHRromatin Organisation MOdifier) domain
MRDRAGKIKYLVEWEGYPHTADYTWEPEQQLREDVPHIVMAWDRARKAKKN